VIVNVAGLIVRLRFAVAVCAGEPESVTLKTSGVLATGVVGVPLISPLEAFSVNPAGSVPEVNCHVKTPVPPDAAIICAYATPACPFGREVVVIDSVAGAIVIVKFADAV
jgi:hypothetical protein